MFVRSRSEQRPAPGVCEIAEVPIGVFAYDRTVGDDVLPGDLFQQIDRCELARALQFGNRGQDRNDTARVGITKAGDLDHGLDSANPDDLSDHGQVLPVPISPCRFHWYSLRRFIWHEMRSLSTSEVGIYQFIFGVSD